MQPLNRRAFLGASLGASLAGLVAGSALGAEGSSSKNEKALKNQTATNKKDNSAFAPSTLFLTWHRDPTTTMTVQWIGAKDETPDTRVYYAALDAGKPGLWLPQVTTTRPYPLSDLQLFRSELTGLAPGTDYQFRIGKQSPTYRFSTMPAKATNPIRFISGGDCGVNPHTVANNVQAARQDPMFALIGGDLAYDDGKSLKTNLAFLRNYSQHMVGHDGRLIPMVACIGNHEVQGGFNKLRANAPFFYSMFEGLYPEHGFATLDFGDYLSLVLLDTGHTTPIAGDQAAWLEQTLKARVDHPNVFVVNHVPAYPSARQMTGNHQHEGTGEENRDHWVPLFDKYRVPVVLEHHDHTFKRTKPLLGGHVNANGVLYLGDGSWGRLRPLQPAEKLPLMAVVGEKYHLSMHCIEGPDRFHLALNEDGKVMDVCRSGQRKSGAVAVPG